MGLLVQVIFTPYNPTIPFLYSIGLLHLMDLLVTLTTFT